MLRNVSRNVCALTLSLLLCGARPLLGQNGCYTPWATKVVLPWYANGQPGLVAFGGKLILTWGDQTTNYLNTAVSTDGVNWTNQQAFGSFPLVYSTVAQNAPSAAGGVNMTASTYCNQVYVAYADQTGDNIYGASSPDGIAWQGGSLIWSAEGPTSSPALYGGNSALPVGFAGPQLAAAVYDGFGYQQGKASDSGGAITVIYTMQVGQFNCDFTNPRLLSNNCFFWDASTGTCLDWASSVNAEYDQACSMWEPGNQYRLEYYYGLNMEYDEGYIANSGIRSGPWSPLWTGAPGPSGNVELRALGQGNALGNLNPPIWYSINQGNASCVGADCAPPNLAGQQTNNGIGGAVNPADGTKWLVWSCRYFNSDTCSGTPWINFYEVDTGNWCTENTNRGGTGEWSMAMPAMTFFNGMLWLAWRGGPNPGSGDINVASIAPSNIGWNGPPPPPPPPCTCPTCPAGEVCRPATCPVCQFPTDGPATGP